MSEVNADPADVQALDDFLSDVAGRADEGSRVPQVMEMTRELLGAGEYSITMELLCEALQELGVALTRTESELLERLAEEWDAVYDWQALDSLPRLADTRMDDARERLRDAVAAVQRDLDASGIDRRIELRDVGRQEGWWVAFDDGGRSAHVIELEGDDQDSARWTVASSVQDLVNDCLWQAWPVCPQHGLGLHLRSVGPSAHWDLNNPDDEEWGTPGWWCRANAHLVAPVGGLAG